MIIKHIVIFVGLTLLLLPKSPPQEHESELLYILVSWQFRFVFICSGPSGSLATKVSTTIYGPTLKYSAVWPIFNPYLYLESIQVGFV